MNRTPIERLGDYHHNHMRLPMVGDPGYGLAWREGTRAVYRETLHAQRLRNAPSMCEAA
jgi:23S rRNA-/tRNA-specific pseudouridylate synthase